MAASRVGGCTAASRAISLAETSHNSLSRNPLHFSRSRLRCKECPQPRYSQLRCSRVQLLGAPCSRCRAADAVQPCRAGQVELNRGQTDPSTVLNASRPRRFRLDLCAGTRRLSSRYVLASASQTRSPFKSHRPDDSQSPRSRFLLTTQSEAAPAMNPQPHPHGISCRAASDRDLTSFARKCSRAPDGNAGNSVLAHSQSYPQVSRQEMNTWAAPKSFSAPARPTARRPNARSFPSAQEMKSAHSVFRSRPLT
jgi:hypothetical protein